MLLVLLCSRLALGQALPTLALTREVVVGGDQIEMKRLVGGRISPNGTIYLSSITGRELLVFGSNGEKRTTLGRYGSGPGDFRSMPYLGFVGDSLWIADGVLRRFTVYSAEDRLAGTRRIEKLIPPRDNSVNVPKVNGGNHVRAIFSDGSMLMMAVDYTMSFDKPNEPTRGFPLFKVSSTGAVQHQVGWIPVSHEMVGPSNNRSQWIYSAFDNRPAHALSVDGALFVTAIPSELDAIVPMATLTVLRASGDPVYTRSIPVATPTIPDSILNREFRSDPRDSKERAELRRTRPRPKFYPPLKDVFISTSGRVLVVFTSDVEHYDGSTRHFATEREYLVLDATGKPVGSFKLPARTLVLQLNDDVIWASDFDRDDVPTIVRYRITAP